MCLPPTNAAPAASAADQLTESKDEEAPVNKPIRRRGAAGKSNPFIDAKEGIDGKLSGEENDFDADLTTEGFF